MKWKIDIMKATKSEANEAIRGMMKGFTDEERVMLGDIQHIAYSLNSMVSHDRKISILGRGEIAEDGTAIGEISFEILSKSAESGAPAGKPGKSLKDGRGASISGEEEASIGEKVRSGLTSFLRGKKGKESKDAKAG